MCDTQRTFFAIVGNFGIVYKGILREDTELPVAVKTVQGKISYLSERYSEIYTLRKTCKYDRTVIALLQQLPHDTCNHTYLGKIGTQKDSIQEMKFWIEGVIFWQDPRIVWSQCPQPHFKWTRNRSISLNPKDNME